MALENSLELDVIKEQVKQYCAFSLGRTNIDNTTVNYDPLIIREENARIREALACVVHYDTIPFGGVSDISAILLDAKKGRVLTEQELLQEMRFIEGVKGVHAYWKSLSDVTLNRLNDLFSSLSIHDSLLHKLSVCINEYGEVKDSASSTLRTIRGQMRHIEHEINEAARKFIAAHSGSVVDSIVTTRGGRAVVLVKAAEKNTFGGMVYGDSASGQASYVEPASFVRLNNRRENLYHEEREEIHKILEDCSKAVGAVADAELANLETLGILDALFAKAAWGKAHNGVVANLSEDNSLSIIRARHPLIDPKVVVANDYRIIPPHRLLLITGPNTGGKTVSMKVIGLFVLMTYCGMPVTCDEAHIPFFDRVFADIGDEQSVVASLSNFSAHMVKQAEICREADRDSLVLLDEVGSGTDPQEGESLAIAILNDLREKKCMTVATTHYNRLKSYGKRHSDILLASVQFDHEKLSPTYRYMEGLTGQSNAFEIAEKYGLPKGIVKYARFLKSQAKTQEDELIEKLEKQLNDNVLREKKLEELIAENKALQKSLDEEKKRLDHDKDVIRAKAEEEAAVYVEETKAKADQILKDLRTHQQSSRYHEALSYRKNLNSLEAKKQEEEVVANAEYHLHDAVELRSSGQVCEIIRMEKKDITVLLNGREVKVKKNQIRPSTHVIPRHVETSTISMPKATLFATMSTEVNLIGLHVDEALEKLDAYLDEVKVHGLKSCRVIHGDGSGALRKAVHKRLAADHSVKSFRLGAPSEGGTGATVVTMK